MSLIVTRRVLVLLALLLAIGSSSQARAWEFNFAAFVHEQEQVEEAKVRDGKLDEETKEKSQHLRSLAADALRQYRFRRYRESAALFEQAAEQAVSLGENYGVWLALTRVGQGIALSDLDEYEAAAKLWCAADAGLREYIAYAKVSELEGIPLVEFRKATLTFAGLAWCQKREWIQAERCYATAVSLETAPADKSNCEMQVSWLVALAVCQLNCRKREEAQISINRVEAICREFPAECRDWIEILEGIRKRGSQ